MKCFKFVVVAMICAAMGAGAMAYSSYDERAFAPSGQVDASLFFAQPMPEQQPDVAEAWGRWRSSNKQTASAAPESATETQSVAEVVYAVSHTGSNWAISSVDLSTGAVATECALSGGMFAYACAIWDGVRYYVLQQFVQGTTVYANNFLVLNDQWAQQTIVQTQAISGPTTYSTAASTAYGVTQQGATARLNTISLSTGTVTPIGNLDKALVALAADATGTLFGIASDGVLYSVDASTAALTPIGSTGVAAGTATQTATVLSSGDICWMASDGNIYRVNTSTGAASVITNCGAAGTQWLGAFVKDSEHVIVPSWVENVIIDFAGDALAGSVYFNLPTLSTEDQTLSGVVGYEVQLNDEIVARGQGAPGQRVEAEIAASASGIYRVVILAKCGDTRGADVQQTRYIGHDTPKAPGFVCIDTSNGPKAVDVSWGAVTAGVDGGYINADDITYTVVRNPGNVTVADGVADTHIVDNTVPGLETYTYRVRATDGVTTGEFATSDPEVIGRDMGIVPPWSYTFTGNGQGFFRVSDANLDGRTWTYSESDKVMWMLMNPDNAADDWLFTPALSLQEGCIYNIRMNLSGSVRGEKQRIEVKGGTAASASAMTETILVSNEFYNSKAYNFGFTATCTGVTYVGIHVISDASNGALMISDFEISGGVDGRAPAAPSYVGATAAAHGELGANVQFTAPDINFVGNALSQIQSAIVTNVTTGQVVATLTDVAPGRQYAVTDNAPERGLNTYSVICTNQYGTGGERTRQIWVGADVPDVPKSVNWVQQGAKAILTWDVPQRGQHDGYIDFDALKYAVLDRVTQQIIYEGSEHRVEFEPDMGDKQQILLRYYVFAMGPDEVPGAVQASNEAPFGNPYQAPIYESFQGAAVGTEPWHLVFEQGNNPFYALSYLTDFNVLPFDGDGGYLVYTALAGGTSHIATPLLDMTGLSEPMLKLWYYMQDDNTRLSMYYTVDRGATWHEIGTLTQPVKGEWTLLSCDLSELKDIAEVQLCLRAVSQNTGGYVLIDNISIADAPATDAMVYHIEAPAKILAGARYTLNVGVANNGVTPLSGYEVEVSHGDKLITSVQGPPLQSDGRAILQIPVKAPSTERGTVDIWARVKHTRDADDSNDERGYRTNVQAPYVPAPLDLVKGDGSDDEHVELSWTAPESVCNVPTTDDMESYEPGSIGGIDVSYDFDANIWHRNCQVGAIGPYKLVDGDGLLTGSLAMLSLPNQNKGMACQVIDNVQFGMTTHSVMAPHSGSRYLCFWHAMTPGNDFNVANDDWLILPQLSETDKYISFWAKSITDKYGLESFKIMVSVTTDLPEAFTEFNEVKYVQAGYSYAPDAGYSFYEFDLPEDTRYVAIRYTPVGTTGLLIDDITYTAASSRKEISLVGYNLYRNGVKVNDYPIYGTEYGDAPGEVGLHRYNVTSEFDEGESAYSNTVSHSVLAAMGNVESDSEANGLWVNGRTLTLRADEGQTVMISDLSGRIVMRGVCSGQLQSFTLMPGAYCVRFGSAATVVVIR